MARQGFGGLLGDAQWESLLRAGSVRVHSESDCVMEQGKRDDTVHLLVRGSVKVSVLMREGVETPIAVRGPGEVLGEMSVMSGLPRTATVRSTREGCTTHVIRGRTFRHLIRSMDLDRALWEHSVRRQQESEALRTQMAALTSRQRMAETMIRLSTPLAAGDGGERGIELHLTQRELGDALGRSLSWVQGELRRLREEGVVSTRRRKLVIHSAEELRRAADAAEGQPTS
ncbi:MULTISPECIES: Crp/Fnr family transcriptional regulator [unclassified Nocardiopsis]|uniref:Crp/Fnr family transcriptional regulator n=1 Tax=unclassified Nocardiopsis TaxID=2649073 RepID=UPI001359356E|nr:MULTISPECIES: Crp/Fnr family transcriptional regulator [unclassified Nocardiopsis]